MIEVHTKIAAAEGVEQAVVDAVDRRRLDVIELFKADLGIEKEQNPPRVPPSS